MQLRVLESTDLYAWGMAQGRTFFSDQAVGVVGTVEEAGRVSVIAWDASGSLLEHERLLLQAGTSCRVEDLASGETIAQEELEANEKRPEIGLGLLGGRLVASRFGRLRLLEQGKEIAGLPGEVFYQWCLGEAFFRFLPKEGEAPAVLVEYDQELRERWRRPNSAECRVKLYHYRLAMPISDQMVVALGGEAKGRTLVRGIDRRTGEQTWERDVEGLSSFVVSGDQVYLGSKNRFLQLEGVGGELVREVAVAGAGDTIAVPVSSGVLVISEADSKLRLFGPQGALQKELAFTDWKVQTTDGVKWMGDRVCCLAKGPARGGEALLMIDVSQPDAIETVGLPGATIERTMAEGESVYRLRIEPGELYDVTRKIRMELRYLAYRTGCEREQWHDPDSVDTEHKGRVIVEVASALEKADRARLEALLRAEEKWAVDLWLSAGGTGPFKFELAKKTPGDQSRRGAIANLSLPGGSGSPE
jgi:hypothetical protein